MGVRGRTVGVCAPVPVPVPVDVATPPLCLRFPSPGFGLPPPPPPRVWVVYPTINRPPRLAHLGHFLTSSSRTTALLLLFRIPHWLATDTFRTQCEDCATDLPRQGFLVALLSTNNRLAGLGGSQASIS